MRSRLMAGVWPALGFVLGLVLAIGGVALEKFFSWFPGGPRFDASQPTVVRQVRQLQRLESVVFAMDKIVAGGYENRFLPRSLAGDRLLLIVYGDVTAGIDLGRVDSSSIKVDGRSVHLLLPAAEIFSTRLDNQRTRVYSRETGLFSSVDPNLESQMRQEAERQVRQAALDGGILQTATTNATATLKSFLEGLGFEQVDIRPAALP